ncbi:hypothetical protein F5B17DRAFT_421417 [Nemania serpens]|nr:hypothetical protein F5B17DRAFT_421417 [Nemania serpens]
MRSSCPCKYLLRRTWSTMLAIWIGPLRGIDAETVKATGLFTLVSRRLRKNRKGSVGLSSVLLYWWASSKNIKAAPIKFITMSPFSSEARLLILLYIA